MKNITQNLVLLTFLLANHIGISGTNSYSYKEVKNYNYLDSGEYYIDSNFNFENLFPEDSIAKEVEIKFVKFKTVYGAGDSYFNVCKIKNKTNKILDLDFKLNMPAGWELLSSSSLFSRSVIPGGEINIPIRITIPQNAIGGAAYVINLVASTKEKEFYGASYIKLPVISDWGMKATKTDIYFNERFNTENFEIYLFNRGNRQEIISLNFIIGKNLKMLDSINNYNAFVSLQPFSDTVISYEVEKSDISQSDVYSSPIWRDNQIVVSALGRNGGKKIKYFKFFDLDNVYNNQRDQAYSPLNFEFSVFNLVSGLPTFTSIRAYGQVQLNKTNEFDYVSSFSNLNLLSIGSYLKNPALYGFQLNHNWNNKLRTSLGNIRPGSSMLTFRGTGIRSSYRLENGSHIDFSYGNNRFNDEVLVSSSYGSKIILPIIKKDIKFNFSLNYLNNSRSSFNAFLPSLKLGFSPLKTHYIDFELAPGFGNYTFSGNPANSDSSVFGNLYRINYGGSVSKKISFGFSKFNSLNTLQMTQGINSTIGTIKYALNKKSTIKLTSNNSILLPSNTFLDQFISSQYQGQSQSSNNLLFNSRFNKKISFNGGARYVSVGRQSFLGRENLVSNFVNQTFGVSGLVRVKLNKSELISPSIFLGRTNFENKLIDSLNFRGANNISFGINYFTPVFDLNVRYLKGASFFIDQNVFVSESTQILLETIYVRGNYTKVIPSRNLRLEGSFNWFLRMPKNIQNFGLSGRMSFQINRRLNGYTSANIFTNSLSNDEDGSSSSRMFNLNFGFVYNVDIQQPKIKYYDLKIVCFEDLNGDKIMSDNEVGIPNIILNIKRDFESDFLETRFDDKELISDLEGNIVLNDLPEGDFFLNFRSLENLGVLYNTNGSDQKVSVNEDYTLFVPYGEGYKVTGQVKISRDVNSTLGVVKPSGIRVEAVSTTGEIYTTLTSVNGSFSISVPRAGYYKISINNIFGNNFYIKNNKMIVQFDGFKLFRVDFDVVEKSREVIINGGSKFNFGKQ